MKRVPRPAALAGLLTMLAVVVALAFFLVQPGRSSGHFDNGEFSFDYPTTWRTFPVSSPSNGMPNPSRTEVVVGNGDWALDCESSGYCRPDKVDVSGGRVVVKVTRRIDGPPTPCSSVSPTGPLATRSEEGGMVVWEIRQPGVPSGYLGNAYLQVWMDGTAAEPEVAALVASFRWDPKASSLAAPCGSPTPVALGPTTHYEKNGVSFDYPAGWIDLGNPPDGNDPGRLVFAVGSGQGNVAWCFDQLMGKGLQCQEPEPQMTGDQVMVFMYERPYPKPASPVSAASAPPGQAVTTVAGRPDHKASGYHWARWWLTDATYIAAYWGADAADDQPEVQALVDGLKLPN